MHRTQPDEIRLLLADALEAAAVVLRGGPPIVDTSPAEATAPPKGKMLLSVPETAERLSISRSKVYELIAADVIPSVKLGNRRLVPVDQLRSAVASLTSSAPAEPR